MAQEKQLLLAAFLDERFEMKYFLEYKAIFSTTEWEEERERIIHRVLEKDNNNAHTLAQIYIEEKFFDRLLDLLLQKQKERYSGNLIHTYGHHLHDHFPKEMLAIYEPMLVNQASNAGSRSDYYKVASELKDLLEIKGGRKIFVKLLKEFKTQYVRRPAMMDELRWVL